MEKASIARTEKEGNGLKLRKEAVSAALLIAGEVIYHQERQGTKEEISMSPTTTGEIVP